MTHDYMRGIQDCRLLSRMSRRFSLLDGIGLWEDKLQPNDLNQDEKICFFFFSFSTV